MNPCPDNPRSGEILSKNDLVVNPTNETSDKPLTKNLVNDHVPDVPKTVNVSAVESHKEA